MTPTQTDAVLRICDAIVEAVEASNPSIGAPGGHLYAALMSSGCTLHQFNSIMVVLVRAGRLTKRGECYFAVAKPL